MNPGRRSYPYNEQRAELSKSLYVKIIHVFMALRPLPLSDWRRGTGCSVSSLSALASCAVPSAHAVHGTWWPNILPASTQMTQLTSPHWPGQAPADSRLDLGGRGQRVEDPVWCLPPTTLDRRRWPLDLTTCTGLWRRWAELRETGLAHSTHSNTAHPPGQCVASPCHASVWPLDESQCRSCGLQARLCFVIKEFNVCSPSLGFCYTDDFVHILVFCAVFWFFTWKRT